MTLHRFWWLLGALLVGAVIGLCLAPGGSLPSTPFNDKLNHSIVHFVMAGYFSGLVPRQRWWKIFVALVLLGVGLEVAQQLMHVGRQADPLDAVANTIGIFFGLLAGALGLARWPELAAWLLGRRAAQ